MHHRLLATAGHRLTPMPLCRNFKDMITHLPLSMHLAAPAYRRTVVFTSGPISTVALVEPRRSPHRIKMVSPALTATR